MRFPVPALATMLLLLAASAVSPSLGVAARNGGDSARVTLVAAGDIAKCAAPGAPEASALATGAQVRKRLERRPDAIVALLGDNAYRSGSREDYDCFDEAWGFARGQMRPAPGNHDYETPGAAGYFDYFGASAGDPSQGYYSYTAGTWHIVVLNTNDGCRQVGCGDGSEQLAWLERDLAANASASCTLAYWHHPRYSSGWHGRPDRARDADNPDENDQLEFIQPMWATLASNGVDVVLNGHDHHYERFAPMNAAGTVDPAGMRAFIVGTGGGEITGNRDLVGWWSGRNSEVRQEGVWGVLTLRLGTDGYRWRFMSTESSPANDDRERYADSGTGSCH